MGQTSLRLLLVLTQLWYFFPVSLLFNNTLGIKSVTSHSFHNQALASLVLSVKSPGNRLAAREQKWMAIEHSLAEDFPILSRLLEKSRRVLLWIPLLYSVQAYHRKFNPEEISGTRQIDASRLWWGLTSLWISSMVSYFVPTPIVRFPVFFVAAWTMRMHATAFIHGIKYGKVYGLKAYRYVMAGMMTDAVWYFLKPFIATLFLGNPHAILYRLSIDTVISYFSIFAFFWLAHYFQGLTANEYQYIRRNLLSRFVVGHIPYWTLLNGFLFYGYLSQYPQAIPFVNNFFSFIYVLGLAWLGNRGAFIPSKPQAQNNRLWDNRGTAAA